MHCSDYINNKFFIKKDYKILVVEDSKFVNKLLFDSLSKYGYSVEQAYTLKEANSILSSSHFDLIILDLHLPDGEGDELIEEMKDIAETKVIVLTADDDKMMREHIYQQGVLEYFNKDNKLPYTISLINSIIENIQENHDTKVLIIDDSNLVRKYLTTLLTPRNYQVIIARNGTQGLEILKEQPIDLVILDMELPDIHGIKVLNKIKSDINLMEIQVLVLSGTSDPNIISTVLKSGASSFMKKPFISEELVLSVDTWIGYSREKKKGLCQQLSLQEYQAAIDRNSIVSRTNAEGIITHTNDHFCEISGYSREELIGQSHNIVRHPDEDSATFKNLWKTIKSGKPWSGTVKNLAKDGSTYYVDITISPIFDIDGSIKEYLAIRHDITDMKLVHEHLNKELKITASSFNEANKLASQYENALLESNLIFRTNKAGDITYVNQHFSEVTGFVHSDLEIQSYKSLLNAESYDEIGSQIEAAFENEQGWKGEIKGFSKTNTPYCLTSTITPITASNGKVTEYIFVCHDITEIKTLNQEIKEKDDMLSMQSRHAAMGEMISMITHQWKQPLSTMSALSNKIQLSVALEKIKPETLLEHAVTIEQQIQYLAETINDFKNFFKPSKDKENVKIQAVMDDTLKLMGKLLIDQKINVTMQMNSTSKISIYPTELLQVIVNLLKNAHDAFENKAIEDKTIIISSYEDDKNVTIEILDNAGGIPEDIITNIFNPYYTTKSDDKGTGLGLHICRTIIQKHMNGTINVTNKDKGACFVITLPK